MTPAHRVFPNPPHVSSLLPLSGEYALAEYTEVKAVTVKLSETL